MIITTGAQCIYANDSQYTAVSAYFNLIREFRVEGFSV